MKRKHTSNIILNDVFKVYFDFETSGQSRSRIVSIGFVSDDATFQGELLMIPDVHIDYGAYGVHGYTHEKLLKEGAKSTQVQLRNFMESIERIHRPVLMIAHNGKSFDTHVLRHVMVRYDVRMASNIIGFMDSLWFVRSALNIKYASIDSLMERFWNDEPRNIHGALEDCKILKRIVEHVICITNIENALYFESADEFLVRTQKWESEEEILKDLMDEMIYKIEKECKHVSYTSKFLDVDEKKCLCKCDNCSHWFLVTLDVL